MDLSQEWYSMRSEEAQACLYLWIYIYIYIRNAYPECDKQMVGSLEHHQVRSGIMPWPTSPTAMIQHLFTSACHKHEVYAVILLAVIVRLSILEKYGSGQNYCKTIMHESWFSDTNQFWVFELGQALAVQAINLETEQFQPLNWVSVSQFIWRAAPKNAVQYWSRGMLSHQQVG